MAKLGPDGTPGTPARVPVGKGPCAVALGPDGGRAYVAGYDEGTLSVLVVPGGSPTTVRLSGALCAVAAGLVAEQVCVASWTDDVVHVLDGDGNGGRAVQVAGGPFALAGAPGSRWVCVAHDKDEGAARRLYVVDVGTPGSPTAAPVAMPAPVRAVAVSPDGRFGYALCEGTGVVVVDLARATVTASRPVGPGPATVVVGHDRLWIADQESAELWVATLDAGTGEPGAFTALPAARRPSAVLLSPDGAVAHVLSRTTGVLSAVFPALPAARTDVPAGVLPSALARDPEGRFVHVTDQATGKIRTLRVGPAVTGRIDTGDVTKPFATGVTPDGLWACTTDTSGHRVAVADLNAGTHRGTIAIAPPSGTTAWGIAMGPTFACVTSPGTDQLLTLRPAEGHDFGDTSTVTVKPTALAHGAQPHGVAVSPDGRYAVTADAGTGTASRVDLRGGTYTLSEDVVKCEIPLGLAIRNDTLYVADYVSQQMNVPKGQISVLRRTESGWTFERAIEKDQGHFTGPHEIALSSGGDHLYVTNYDSRGDRPVKVSILRWNGTSWEFRQGIERSDLTNPHGLALSGEDSDRKAQLYVSSAATGKVAQFTVTDNSDVKFDCWLTIEPSTDLPASLALSPDGTYLYATHNGRGRVYGIAVPQPSDAAMTAVGDLTVDGVRGVACRGTDTLYVVTEKSSAAAGLTTVTLDHTRLSAASVSQPQPLTEYPWTIVAGDDDTLYIADYRRQEIAVRGTGVTPIPLKSSDDSRPWEVACTPDGGYAYVTDRSLKAPSVHWVDLATAQRSATLPVGADPVGVACAPDGLRAYVACAGDRSVSVLRRHPELTAGSTTTADPAVPLSLAVHPTAPYAYRVHQDALCPVRLAGTDDGQRLRLQGGLCDVAIHPGGTLAYLPGAGAQGEPVLHVVRLENPATPAIGPAVPLPGTQPPTALALHPHGTHGYVTGSLNGTVALWALTLATPDRPTVADAFPLSLPSVRSMAVAPAHLYALTAEGADDAALHVLELSALPDAPIERPRATLSLPGRPRSIRVHPLGGHAYVSTDDKGVHLLDLTDPARPQLVGTVSADAGAAAFRPDGTGALLAHKDRIRGLGLGAPQVLPDVWKLPGTTAPRRLLVSADGGSVYVTDENGGDLRVLDAASGAVRHTVRTGTALAGLALRPGTAGRRLYVVDEGAPGLVTADMAELVPVGTALEAGIDLRQVHVAKETSS
ncbi:hypothetical protein [Streptomyces sp. NPDC046261]|uniref:hypothetical protein n=1 Tax=Streptomyces sp. NPDC046261 TaxID=3157200 RepID=UPI0033E0F64B